jgi:FRG domain
VVSARARAATAKRQNRNSRKSKFAKRQKCKVENRAEKQKPRWLFTTEPFHPYHPSTMAARLAELGFAPDVQRTLETSGLSILSVSLIEAYAETLDVPSPFEHLRGVSSSSSGNLLFDPYYGFAFWREGTRYRTALVSLGEWLRLKDRFPQLISELGSNLTPLLAQGAMLGNTLFGDALGADVKNVFDRSEVPEIMVFSAAELSDLFATIQASATNSDKVVLWYRGQCEDYIIPDRMPLFEMGIVPYGDVCDSSLIPSLYRSLDSYCDDPNSYTRLHAEIDWWRSAARKLVPPPYTVRHPSQPAKEFSDLPGANLSWKMTTYRKDTGEVVDTEVHDHHDSFCEMSRGLLLQHYGCPTGWIDVTSDPSVATWFATHKLMTTTNGLTQCTPHTWETPSPDTWPTIFVLPMLPGIHPVVDTETIARGTKALRPTRQKCGVVGGAGNLARNFSARYIALKIRLAPGFIASEDYSAEYLFPNQDEDACLAHVLDYENRNARPTEFPVYGLVSSA